MGGRASWGLARQSIVQVATVSASEQASTPCIVLALNRDAVYKRKRD